jgi:hypothetical protein
MTACSVVVEIDDTIHAAAHPAPLAECKLLEALYTRPADECILLTCDERLCTSPAGVSTSSCAEWLWPCSDNLLAACGCELAGKRHAK